MIDNLRSVGKIKKSRLPYYHSETHSIRYKARPVLILKAERQRGASDFTALPVSSISHKQNINREYDIEVQSIEYPRLNLTKDISYIRVGKVTTIHSSDMAQDSISDLKSEYPELWNEVTTKVKQFIDEIN